MTNIPDEIQDKANSDAYERLSQRLATDHVIEEVEDYEEMSKWDWDEYDELERLCGYE